MRTNILYILCIFLIFINSASFAQQRQDKVFHYSTMEAMRNAVYSGEMRVDELKNKGDFGLGTYNLLDGELIALDGLFYRIAADGKIEKASSERKIPFASVTFFKQDTLVIVDKVNDFSSLQDAILRSLPSANHFYAIRIPVTFDNIVAGGANKVKIDERKGIASFMVTRPLYRAKQITGTIVGFYCPPFIGGIDLSPFHFHFISDDKTFGGHMISGTISPNTKINVLLDVKEHYEIELPLLQNKGYQKQWKEIQSQKSY